MEKMDDPSGETPQMSEMAHRKAASTMKFFYFTVLTKAEEYKFALCFLPGWRNSKKIPKALELITADDGYSCKHTRRR